MDINVTPLEALVTVIVGVIVGVLRYFDRRAADKRAQELALVVSASAERSRRRDKRERRESSGPQRLPAKDAVPQEFADEENTDMHELVEMERKRVARQRPGDRPPRKGTHHD